MFIEYSVGHGIVLCTVGIKYPTYECFHIDIDSNKLITVCG